MRQKEEIEERQVNKDKQSFFSETIESYLKGIGKTPLLSREEEVELAKKIKKERKELIKLLTKVALIIKSDPDFLELFKKVGGVGKNLDNLGKDIGRIRETLDFLRENRKQIDKIKPCQKREKLKQIFQKIEEIMARYELHRKKMMEANLRLVVSFAKKYTGKGVSFLDLIQEGNIGLSRAIDKFDYKCERRFSTYASWWIRQALSRTIADQSRTIRLPVHIVHLLKKLSRVSRQLEQKLKREPTAEEIAEEVKFPPEKIREALGITQDAISLDKPMGEEKDNSMINFVSNATIPSPVYKLTLEILKKEVRKLLEKVVKDPRELEILRLRFGLEEGEDYSLREIGKRYGVSRERVRQIQERALSRLRVPAEKRGLKGYLELLDSLRVDIQEE